MPATQRAFRWPLAMSVALLMIWRIDSSAASLAAIRSALSGPEFLSHPRLVTYLPLLLR